jgi:hypothetical protein
MTFVFDANASNVDFGSGFDNASDTGDGNPGTVRTVPDVWMFSNAYKFI